MMLNQNQFKIMMFIVVVAQFEGLRYWEECKSSFDFEFETMEEAIEDLLDALSKEPKPTSPRVQQALDILRRTTDA